MVLVEWPLNFKIVNSSEDVQYEICIKILSITYIYIYIHTHMYMACPKSKCTDFPMYELVV